MQRFRQHQTRSGNARDDIPRSALVDDGRDGQRLATAFRSLLAGLPGEAMVQDGCNL
jgi:hypothetical protein